MAHTDRGVHAITIHPPPRCSLYVPVDTQYKATWHTKTEEYTPSSSNKLHATLQSLGTGRHTGATHHTRTEGCTPSSSNKLHATVSKVQVDTQGYMAHKDRGLDVTTIHPTPRHSLQGTGRHTVQGYTSHKDRGVHVTTIHPTPRCSLQGTGRHTGVRGTQGQRDASHHHPPNSTPQSPRYRSTHRATWHTRTEE